MITIFSHVICALAASFFTNRSVQLYSNTCNGTIEAANHTKSIKLNPPITELITITIATITYPKKNGDLPKWRNF